MRKWSIHQNDITVLNVVDLTRDSKCMKEFCWNHCEQQQIKNRELGFLFSPNCSGGDLSVFLVEMESAFLYFDINKLCIEKKSILPHADGSLESSHTGLPSAWGPQTPSHRRVCTGTGPPAGIFHHPLLHVLLLVL